MYIGEKNAPQKMKKDLSKLRLASTNVTDAGVPDQATYYNPLLK